MSNSSFTVQLSTTDQNDIFLDFEPGNWSLDLRSVSWLSVIPSTIEKVTEPQTDIDQSIQFYIWETLVHTMEHV